MTEPYKRVEKGMGPRSRPSIGLHTMLSLYLKRELAAAKGEEYAVPVDFPVKWDAGCPLPHLLCNDYKALLAFILRETNRGGMDQALRWSAQGTKS